LPITRTLMALKDEGCTVILRLALTCRLPTIMARGLPWTEK